MASSTPMSNADLSAFFGWDLLYKTVEGTVSKNADIVIALVHFVIIKQFNFRCLGVGEDKKLAENETGSELLPSGWNTDDNKYALRYRFNNQLFILMAHRSLDYWIINLVDAEKMAVANITVEPDKLVATRTGAITDIFPTASEIANRLRMELVEPVFPGNSRGTASQTTSATDDSLTSVQPRRESPLRVNDPPIYRPFNPDRHPLGFGVFPGRGDLDPLGRGPGNLAGFPSHGNFRGPRFDPYITPGLRFPGEPNSDEFPPPGLGGHDYYT